MATGKAAWTFLRDAQEAFREAPQLRPLVAANMLSQATAALLITGVPFLLISKGLSLLALGGVFSLMALGAMGMSFLAARHQAFFGRREVVLCLLLASALTLPLYLLVDSPLGFLLVGAASGFAASAASPGLQSLVAEAAAPHRRARVFGYLGAAGGLSYATGLILAGVLMEWGFEVVFRAGAVLALGGFLAMSRFVAADGLRRRRRVAPPGMEGLDAQGDALERDLRGWWMDLGAARRRLEGRLPQPPAALRNVRWASLHTFLFMLSLAIYPVYFPLFLVNDHGLPFKWVGVVVASSWVTFALAQPLGGHLSDRAGMRHALVAGSLVAAAVLTLALAWGPLWLVVAAWVALGVADGIGRPVTQAIVVESVERAGRARSFAWVSAGEQGARIVAPFALAYLVGPRDVSHGLLYVAGAVALSIVPLLLIRRLPDEPPAAAPAPPRGEPA